MRRVDRVRLEKRRRLVLTAGLAFAIGALTAGALIWRGDLAVTAARTAALDTTAADTMAADSTSKSREVVEAASSPALAGTSGTHGPEKVRATSVVNGDAVQVLKNRRLEMPVDGVSRNQLRDSFDERRGGGLRGHEALDIMAPRGTPVRAVEAGRIAKLFQSVPGGLTIYLFDPGEMFSYYFAHLDRYAAGLAEGQQVRRGEVIGYVGSTGNASEDAPHLHFAISQLNDDHKWWQGTPINPYPVLH
jgi:murein DD-endopeptidase MepM/ murein hydrolase activator NlpD